VSGPVSAGARDAEPMDRTQVSARRLKPVMRERMDENSLGSERGQSTRM
jgi:hypothetical protein